MAVTAKFYGKAFVSAFSKKMDLTSDTLKVMLLDNTYTPDQDGDQYKSDLTGEITGTGYTAGGATISGASVSYDAATNTLKIDGGDVSWDDSTLSAYYAVVYDSTPSTDATRPLIAYVDFGGEVSSVAAPFSITWNAAGIATVTVD